MTYAGHPLSTAAPGSVSGYALRSWPMASGSSTRTGRASSSIQARRSGGEAGGGGRGGGPGFQKGGGAGGEQGVQGVAGGRTRVRGGRVGQLLLAGQPGRRYVGAGLGGGGQEPGE